ncbi:hypothetical protein WBP06_13570 [Novosphingobium sp. BL-8H]|uniref:hypothetical protein n=1 Tax=Novosphingobium sp. BL-8H TaxID=3127640 RepID=UPI00375652B8
MDDFELITVEEMDELPDDPQEAFVIFEGICRRRMNAYISNIGINDNTDADEIRIEYMTRIGAAAAAYGIVELADSYYTDFNPTDFKILYRKAVAAATRLNIEKRQKQKGSIVVLPSGTKERLKKHLEELRKAVATSDLGDKRKKILEGKLNAFSKELDGEKSNITVILAAVAVVAAGINQTLSGVNNFQKVIIDMPKTVEAISNLVGKESLSEQEQAALPPPPSVKALPPPGGTARWTTTSTFGADLDDDIPF